MSELNYPVYMIERAARAGEGILLRATVAHRRAAPVHVAWAEVKLIKEDGSPPKAGQYYNHSKEIWSPRQLVV